MSFLKKLFGGGNRPYVDKNGIYIYAKCDNCSTIVRVRADKQHDLNRDGDVLSWHKTIVDSKCFRRMQATVYFDSNYQISKYELSGGVLVDEAAYNAFMAAKETAPTVVDDDS